MDTSLLGIFPCSELHFYYNTSSNCYYYWPYDSTYSRLGIVHAHKTWPQSLSQRKRLYWTCLSKSINVWLGQRLLWTLSNMTPLWRDTVTYQWVNPVISCHQPAVWISVNTDEWHNILNKKAEIRGRKVKSNLTIVQGTGEMSLYLSVLTYNKQLQARKDSIPSPVY